MSDQPQTPVFQIQRVYLKDMSLEQPHAPQILLEQAQPQVDINLGVGAENVADGIYEVTVTATVTTTVGEKTLFWWKPSKLAFLRSATSLSSRFSRFLASPAPPSFIPTCVP